MNFSPIPRSRLPGILPFSNSSAFGLTVPLFLVSFGKDIDEMSVMYYLKKGLSGETGENPVRARRRKVLKYILTAMHT